MPLAYNLRLGTAILLGLLAISAQAQEPEKVVVPELGAAQQPVAQPVQPVVTNTLKAEPASPVAALKENPKKETEDSPLRRALAEAYLHNSQLEAQRKAQTALDERVPQALSGALPNATIGYQDGRRRTRTGASAWSYNDATTENLTVVQPLFRGGTTWANTKAARYEVEAGRARLWQTEQEVLLNTVQAYMDVVRTKSVVDLSKKNLDVLDKQLNASNQRFEVGEDTRTDVAQSQARVASARSQLIQSEGQFASAMATFRRFTGYDAKDAIMPQDLPEMPKTLEEATAQAEKNNPLLIEAKNLKEAADYLINANVGRILPTVDVRGSLNRQEGVGAFGLSDFDQDEVMLAVSVPIFQAGQEYSRVRESREEYQRRRFAELDTADRVRQQAVSAWESWQAAKATLMSDQAAIEAAKVALEGVKQEQQYGARTTLDVLDAERELFDAEVRHVTSRSEEVVAAYGLLSAIGRLTAQALNLQVPLYDPNKHFEDVEYQFIGF